MSPTPELPGTLIPRHSERELFLKSHVSKLCNIGHDRFPGSQPVSFSSKDLDRLETMDYWVCEKSDGVRVLFVILTNPETDEQLVHIVDRHNTYREITGMYFPSYDHPEKPLRSTIVDAELVVDVDPITNKETLRMLCFDCLVSDNQSNMARTLDKRYYRLKEHFHKPYAKMLQEFPHTAASHPFDIQVKDVNLSYHLEKVFLQDIPHLQHGNDGLIFTPVPTPYVPGTDRNILKWKPPSENSIDFKLVLRFPPIKGKPNSPDMHAKPIFALHVWCGGDGNRATYEPYDVLHVEDEEWERMKESGDQLDDRIVEVHWDVANENWRMMRFRDDKPHGNHRSTVENIIQSIADGVEKDALFSRTETIKNAWKTRAGRAPAPPRPPPSGPPPPYSSSHANHHSQPVRPAPAKGLPKVELRYGPIAESPWSRVSGPQVVAGFNR
ncbi:mRNA capping enzyme, catalytic domain-containing protein [Amylostereum chailletii]|nr:mRNA capping enzyme, catalytic domain-containing protein [Amylostereum chailletii]